MLDASCALMCPPAFAKNTRRRSARQSDSRRRPARLIGSSVGKRPAHSGSSVGQRPAHSCIAAALATAAAFAKNTVAKAHANAIAFASVSEPCVALAYRRAAQG